MLHAARQLPSWLIFDVRQKMKAFAPILVLCFSISQVQARDEPAAGVYRSEVGIYSLTVSLLPNGNYLARWDADIGPNWQSIGFVDPC